MTDGVRRPCAGGLVFDPRHRLLLIRRGQAPSAGSWSVPGGRCRIGERPDLACVREVGEETGVGVEVVRWIGRVERAAPAGGVYVIDDYLCRPDARSLRDGRLRAGDDALDARWVTRDELVGLPLAPGLLDALTTWSVLPG
ncbi:ADP-ribose pyrophosphatase YjhB, NUDIX family [Jatrophihabitans endophyticus]|uniref:ADP-ribose pyrophosphatase YjhB, NUDIX family n=1 Tax=Jatrophihabitans endophyticus TaxID=1206085 RepID=A0A1M5EW49_9ACTN|nr:NUDIX domain-containing protein [Jatrophihabitans endophyticus]SHF83463.1 ADP-ribose pyrophosphatase YjhB, NUDIX family [Jatrophihabitans endophyticus]